MLQTFPLSGNGLVTAPFCYNSSIPNPAPRHPDAAGSRSSAMRSYTLTQAVSSLSPLCALTLEPECLSVGAFPSMSSEIRADVPGHRRCSPGVTPVQQPQVSCSVTCQQTEL